MLRVVGGKYKRRNLLQPPLEITRATKDVAKEGLFSSLGDISNVVFLDLFGGSGAIGIEAYSRGAKEVYINDKNKEAISIIKKNLSNLGIEDIVVTSFDYLEALRHYKSKNMRFDIIFLDPPYKLKIDEDFIKMLLNFNILSENYLLIIETDYDLSNNIYTDFKVKTLKYGRTLMNIVRGI